MKKIEIENPTNESLGKFFFQDILSKHEKGNSYTIKVTSTDGKSLEYEFKTVEEDGVERVKLERITFDTNRKI